MRTPSIVSQSITTLKQNNKTIKPKVHSKSPFEQIVFME